MAGGRPTKYKPEFPDLLRKHLGEGFSFESFAAQANCSFDTLYEWVKVHPEFSDAKKEGTAKSLEFWEKMGRAGAGGKLKGFNVTAWIYTMKCRFPALYGEKQEVSHVISDRRETKKLSDSDLNTLLLESNASIESEKV